MTFCQALKGQIPRNIEIPHVESVFSLQGILLSNVRPSKPQRIHELPEAAIDLLSFWASHSQGLHSTCHSLWIEGLKSRRAHIHIEDISLALHSEYLQLILDSWDRLFELLQIQSSLLHTLAHGDFTPWNMYLANGKLSLYDFELAGTYPAWYDFFHFHYQKGLLQDRRSYLHIREKVNQGKSLSIIKKWLRLQDQDWNSYHLAYLLELGINCLLRYSQERNHVVQSFWMLQLLTDAYQDHFWYNAFDKNHQNK